MEIKRHITITEVHNISGGVTKTEFESHLNSPEALRGGLNGHFDPQNEEFLASANTRVRQISLFWSVTFGTPASASP